MVASKSKLREELKGAMSRHLTVFRGNLLLITNLKLENGNVDLLC